MPSLFENIRNGIDRRRRDRLKGDLLVIQKDKYGFDPFKVNLPNNMAKDNARSLQLVESAVWQSGSVDALVDFYKRNTGLSGDGVAKSSFFYATAPDNCRHVATGFPALYSSKQSTIIFGEGFDIKCTAYKEDGVTEDETVSRKATGLMKTVVMEDNTLADVCDKAGNDESWSGHITVKLSYDTTLTKRPIIESYDATRFDIVKKRGITKAINFNTWIDRSVESPEKKDKRRFKAVETYTTDPTTGDACIIEALYQFDDKGNPFAVPLNQIPETEHFLADKNGYVPMPIDGNEYAIGYVFKGLKGMLAFDKPNKRSSNVFDNSVYGKGDLWGCESLFDSLDETISQLVAEVRENKTLRFLPENMIPTNNDGTINADFTKVARFVTNFVKVKSSADQNAEMPETKEFTDKTDEHVSKYHALIGLLASNGGVSPISLGIPGLESIDSSDKSTRERTKTTVETRNKKIKLWKPFLTNVLVQYMSMLSWMQKNVPGAKPEEPSEKVDLDYGTLDVTVTFPEMVSDTLTEKATIVQTLGSNISTEKLVDFLWPDMKDRDKRQEVNRIKIEKGLSMNSPDILSIDEPTDDGEDNDDLEANKDKKPPKPKG